MRNSIKKLQCVSVMFGIILTLVTLCSCRTAKQISSNVETKYDSIVVEKLVPYALPEDSAKIRALLECDKNGKVVLKWFDEEHSKRMSLQFSLDSLGNLLATAKTEPDTVYLPQTTINVGKKSVSQSVVTVPVEKKLNWWQTTLIWTGAITWLAAIIALLYWSNKKTNWMSLLWKLIKK
ncbi:hypothetical protein [Bacteroides ihuae]|uniref:hypothetical protein n=1 Tax=Bacteroides ihuae TaxID=1852362 RepID=UPI0008D8ECDE|nr:hypothetical protein [Bacteroides ihuae]